MRPLLYMVLVIFCNYACSEKIEYGDGSYTLHEAGESPLTGKLKVVDTLKIDIDSMTGNRDPYLQVVETKGEPYLFLFNPNNFCLQGYHFFNPAKNYKWCMPAEGPNGIRSPERFYVHNADSIFFISGEHTQKIFLADSAGVVARTYDLIPAFASRGKWLTNEFFFQFRYLPESQSVSFWLYPEDAMSYDGYDYYKGASACIYNLNTAEYRLFGGFPRQYFMEDNLYEIFNNLHGYATPGYWVLHYNGSSEVQVYDRTTLAVWRRYRLPSRYIDKVPPLMKLGEPRKTPQEEVDYQAGTGYYFRMQANQSGSRHYRVVFHQAPLKYPSGKKRHYDDIPFSIMVLDGQFRLVDEVAFVGGLFDVYQTFAFGDKFYLSLNNPLNEHYNEDILQFAVLALE